MAVKKVALVVNSSWNIYNFRYNLVSAIEKQGYEVFLIAPEDKYSKILEKNFHYYPIYMNSKGINPIEDIKTLIDFYKIYKEIKPDIVLHYTIKPNIYGSIICRILRIKTINNIAGLGSLFVKKNFVTTIAKYLYRFSQKDAKKVFFQNKEDYHMFVSQKLVPKNRSEILPGSGVDTAKFKLKTPYNKVSKEKFRFLLVSRMLWAKGIGEYVEAAKILSRKYGHVEFHLLGFLDVENSDAISRKQMNEWTDEGSVNYLGVTDNVKEEIEKVDCIVLPSYYREGTPKTLLESASMEKPIITTDNVGCRDVVDHGINGYLCNVKDTQDLVKQMEKMINLPEEQLIKMGKKGREKMIKSFNEEIIIEKYLSAIQGERVKYKCVV